MKIVLLPHCIIEHEYINHIILLSISFVLGVF